MLNPSTKSVNFSKEEYIRYTRHLVLENIGIKGQKRLKKAKILIVGAGGLGCPVMLYLIASGIGYMGIIDNDIINFSNLNRQILYDTDNINNKKAQLAKSKLKYLNNKCKIITHLYYLNNKNAYEIMQYYDIIIDTSDNFNTRYTINNICFKLNKAYIYGAVEGFEGQVGIFNYQDGIKYTDIYSQKFNIEGCNNNGILGVTTGHIGILQAVEAIKLILGFKQTLSNNLLISNLMNINTIKKKFYTKKNYHNLIKNDTKTFIKFKNFISKDILKKTKIKLENKFVILDIRQRFEFYKYHLKNSINIPLNNFKFSQTLKFIAQFSNNKKIVIYCTTINRSIIASKILNYYKIKHYILKNK
uniref:Molybdopterin biosynthesis protein n=1 Tax=Bostrychia simpliciuscula TaxID=324754 RepID=A0A1Z1M8S9_9FLOR|nr:Molybdopterin biosynthesis protein [Bostrychia simpliciuscula]ARW62164.1 Molybdopterin biosynthesis protein [Bostrychia simpliciuscula]